MSQISFENIDGDTVNLDVGTYESTELDGVYKVSIPDNLELIISREDDETYFMGITVPIFQIESSDIIVVQPKQEIPSAPHVAISIEDIGFYRYFVDGEYSINALDKSLFPYFETVKVVIPDKMKFCFDDKCIEGQKILVDFNIEAANPSIISIHSSTIPDEPHLVLSNSNETIYLTQGDYDILDEYSVSTSYNLQFCTEEKCYRGPLTDLIIFQGKLRIGQEKIPDKPHIKLVDIDTNYTINLTYGENRGFYGSLYKLVLPENTEIIAMDYPTILSYVGINGDNTIDLRNASSVVIREKSSIPEEPHITLHTKEGYMKYFTKGSYALEDDLRRLLYLFEDIKIHIPENVVFCMNETDSMCVYGGDSIVLEEIPESIQVKEFIDAPVLIPSNPRASLIIFDESGDQLLDEGEHQVILKNRQGWVAPGYSAIFFSKSNYTGGGIQFNGGDVLIPEVLEKISSVVVSRR